jgi:hypothetical protein
MTDCCSSSNDDKSLKKESNRRNCPACNEVGLSVKFTTILQHLKQPWSKNIKDQNHYFCHTADCHVVYFSNDDSLIPKSKIRDLIGIKELENDATHLCYCFDITHQDYKNDSSLKQYVVDLTKNGSCSCETKNPSGRCCLRDFA